MTTTTAFRTPDLTGAEYLESLAPERANAWLRALLEVGDIALSATSVDGLLETTLARLVALTASEAGHALLLRLGEERLELRVATGSAACQPASRVAVHLGEGLAGHVAESRQPAILNPGGPARRERAPAAMAAPLIAGERLLGVVEMCRTSGSSYAASELQLLALAAERVALALARLIDGADGTSQDAATGIELERRRLRAVMDVLPVGVWVADADGRVIDSNRTAAELWGGQAPLPERPQSYHEHYRGFWPSDGRSLGPGEWGLARAIEKGEVSGPEEVEIQAFDETRRTILNFAAPVRDEDGQGIAGGVAVSIDISDRKRVERQLLQANRRLQLLAETTVRLLGEDRPRKLVHAIFDRLRAELELDAFFNFLVDEDNGRSRLRLDACGGVNDEVARSYAWIDFGAAVCGRVAAERKRIIVEDVQSRGGELVSAIRPLGIQAYVCHPLIAGERLVGTLSFGSRSRTSFAEDELELLKTIADQIAIAIERTRSYRAESEARREAEAASEAKSRFMATVSHELRTPLNAILGYADLLMLGIPAALPDPAHAQVQRISLSTRHLIQLIDEILTHSRLEAGRESVATATFPLADVIQEVQAIIEPLARSKGVRFDTEIAGEVETVTSDPGKLRQILLNLIGNAVKFTDSGEVVLSVSQDDDGIVFRIRDTGPGIPTEHLTRLFEPFWQGDQSNTRTATGTGLGLAITRRLATLLGGDVSVESEPGAGSTFTVRLASRR